MSSPTFYIVLNTILLLSPVLFILGLFLLIKFNRIGWIFIMVDMSIHLATMFVYAGWQAFSMAYIFMHLGVIIVSLLGFFNWKNHQKINYFDSTDVSILDDLQETPKQVKARTASSRELPQNVAFISLLMAFLFVINSLQGGQKVGNLYAVIYALTGLGLYSINKRQIEGWLILSVLFLLILLDYLTIHFMSLGLKTFYIYVAYFFVTAWGYRKWQAQLSR